jgi:type I restriction enzyme S subunit
MMICPDTAVLQRQPLATLTTSISSGKTTRRDRNGRNPLYGSTGQIGETNRAEFTGPSILVARVGANAGSVYVVEGAYGVTDNTLVVRPRKDQSVIFLTEFLKYANLNRLIYGSGQPLVTGTMLKRLEIPAFAPSEQSRIAGVLSDVNVTIVALERLIAKKRAIRQGIMQQLLTGRTRLAGFTDEWKTKSLQEDVTLVSGHHVLAQNCNTRGHGVPYITGPADFPDGRIHQTKFTHKPISMCQAGDILVTVKGSGAGTLVEADASYCISRQLMAIRTNAWDSRFLLYSLLQNAPSIKDAVTGLIPGLSRSDILNQMIPAPSVDEQQAIAAVLSDIDADLDALDARLAKARDIKQGMMQQLLTGGTRLPVQEIPHE